MSLGVASDQLLVTYTSSVTAECRSAVRDAVVDVLSRYGLWTREHQNGIRTAWQVDALGYDPARPQPLRTGEIADLLSSLALQEGQSPEAFLDALRAEMAAQREGDE